MAQPKKIDNETIQKMIEGLESTTTMLQSMLTDMKDSTELISTLKLQVSSMEKEINILNKIVRGTNGTPAVTAKLYIIDQTLERIEKELDKDHEEDRRKEMIDRNGYWGIFRAVMGFLAAVSATIFAYFLGAR